MKQKTGIFIGTIVFSTLIFTGYSDEKDDIKLAHTGATDLEENTAIYRFLNLHEGITDLEYSASGDLVSAILIGKRPLYGTALQAGLRASQQAAIWAACAEFVKSEEVVKRLKGEKPSHAGRADSVSKSFFEAEGSVTGLRVVHLDVREDQVTAILSWKAGPSKSTLGMLPKIKVRSEESMEEIHSDTGWETKMTSKLYINDVLIMDEFISNTTRNNGNEAAIIKVKQFFDDGKPYVEETRTGEFDGQSVAGIIWSESGRKTKY